MKEYIAPKKKRIPYGMMNFAVIRRDDCYYVDKTRFIPIIEDADKFFFFNRPRRLVKNLTVSMLQHYYDIAAKDLLSQMLPHLRFSTLLNFHPCSHRLPNTSYTPSPAALVVTFDTEDSTFGKFSISEQE